jgi:hypothetical protein
MGDGGHENGEMLKVDLWVSIFEKGPAPEEDENQGQRLDLWRSQGLYSNRSERSQYNGRGPLHNITNLSLPRGIVEKKEALL